MKKYANLFLGGAMGLVAHHLTKNIFTSLLICLPIVFLVETLKKKKNQPKESETQQ